MGVMDNLQGATNEQKKAALAALAASGQRGLDAYQAGLGNVDASQQTALARTQAHGAYLGADAQGELSAIAGGPGDAARTALQRQSAGFSADNASRQAATGAYFDQVGAAVPLMKQFGDNQIGAARQKADEDRQRILEQQNWAREEHQMRMDQMAASAAGSGSGKDAYTDAQKLKIAQAMQAEQERAGAQQEMDARIAALNASGQAYFDAQKLTPNESSKAAGGPGVTTTADRAERDANKVISARQSLGWDSGSLDLMDPGRNKPIPTYQPQAGAAAGPTGVLGGAMIGEGIGNSAELQRQAQAKARQDALMLAARQQYAQIEASKSPIEAQRGLLLQDNERVANTRNQAQSLFGDPGLAMLSASYTDPSKLYQDAMNKQQATDQFGNLIQTGYKSPAEQAAALAVQDKLQQYERTAGMDPTILALAKKTNMDPQQVAAARDTTAYNQALQAVMAMPTPSANDVQYAIAQMAAESGDETLLGILPILLSELDAKGLLYNESYVPG